VNETPFYFPTGRYSLFGILHEPAQPVSDRAFVFCHPFAEEKLWSHRVFVSFARLLASGGSAVLRFDCMGNGDSAGDFSESSLATMRNDLHAAIQYVRRRTGVNRVGLLGLRLGGTVVSLVAEERADVDRLILWAPVVDGRRYVQEMLRVNLTSQVAVYREIRQDREALVAAMESGATVNVDGYEMGFSLYSEIAAVNLALNQKVFDGPCLIVQVDRQQRPSAELAQLATCYRTADSRFATEDPFWKEIARSYQRPAANLFAVTADWLSRQ
jgi:exosortase A-associated hydrolase 2